jgi:hypothetical protein
LRLLVMGKEEVLSLFICGDSINGNYLHSAIYG